MLRTWRMPHVPRVVSVAHMKTRCADCKFRRPSLVGRLTCEATMSTPKTDEHVVNMDPGSHLSMLDTRRGKQLALHWRLLNTKNRSLNDAGNEDLT